ncbi:MAG: hypothetical protein K2H53_05540 [Clostridia bacterium]|nr:hypothetical protein [Clostridia bacterium]
MAKDKESEGKVSLFGYDPMQTPEEIIDADKDIDRKEAFNETEKRVMAIIPRYFSDQKKRKPTSSSSSSGGKGFSQEIKITPDNIKVETKGENSLEGRDEERERED